MADAMGGISLFLFYRVECDGGLDDGKSVNAFKRNVFRLEAFVLAYQSDVVRAI